MGAVSAAALCCLLITMVSANRKKRVAGGTPVNSTSLYPWIVFVHAVYMAVGEPDLPFLNTYCGGSFIDIYGSVVTASHCVRTHDIFVNDNEGIVSTLQYVNVTWGVLDPDDKSSGITEKVDVGRIRRYKRSVSDRAVAKLRREEPDSENVSPLHVDIALIYLTTFEKSGMVCNSGHSPRPIKLSVGDQTDFQKTAVFTAGFGSQPIERNGRLWGFSLVGNLTQVSMMYDYHVTPSPPGIHPSNYTTQTRTSRFVAHAIVDQESSDGVQQSFGLRGLCRRDSGGPYMVEGPDGLKQRGVASETSIYVGSDLPCSKIGDPSIFIDIANRYVRKWLLKNLRRRYQSPPIRRRRGPVPAICECYTKC